MPWYDNIVFFFAGAFLLNSIPHLVQGACGNKFPTPFASPPGVGNSSPMVNLVWGWFNYVVGGALLLIFFPPLPPPASAYIAAALGMLISGVWLAHHFGKVRKTAPHP